MGIVFAIIYFILTLIEIIETESVLLIIEIIIYPIIIINASYCISALIKNEAYTLDTLMKIENNTSKNKKDKN